MLGDRSARPPLAERLRPAILVEFIGQDEIVGPETLLSRSIESDELRSIILWGPPGSAKTTLARIIAARTSVRFVSCSAVLAGRNEVQQAMGAAEEDRRAAGGRPVRCR